MEFVEVQNTITNIIEKAFQSDTENTDNAHNNRYIILDDNNDLSTVYSRIEGRILNVGNSTVHRVRSDLNNANEWEKIFDFGSDRVYVAVIAYVDTPLDCLIDNMYKNLEVCIAKYGKLIPGLVKLNIFRIFRYDRNLTNEMHGEKFKAQAEKICKTLSVRFENTKNNVASQAFPNCSIVHTIFFDGSEMEKVNFANEVFYFMKNYNDAAANTVLSASNEDVSLFTAESYPWVTYRIIETFFPEHIFMNCIIGKLRETFICGSFFDEIDVKLDNIADKVRGVYLNRIGLGSLSEVHDIFNAYCGCQPVRISENDFENKPVVRCVPVQKESVLNKFFKKFMREEKTEAPVQVPESSIKLSSDISLLEEQYEKYVLNTVSCEDFYRIVFNSFPIFNNNMPPVKYSEVKSIAAKIIKKVFDCDDEFWNDISRFYVANLQDSFVTDCCNKIKEQTANVLDMFASQIKMYRDVEQYKIKNDSKQIELKFELCDFLDSRKIFEHINNYLAKNTELDAKLLNSFIDIEDSSSIPQNVHLPLEGANKRSEQQYRTKLTKTEENMRKERTVFYKKYTDLEGMQLLSIYNN